MALPRDYFMGGLIFIIFVVGVVTILGYVISGQVGSESTTGVPDLMTNSQQLKTFNESFYPVNLTKNIQELEEDIQDLKVDNLADGITLPVALISTAWDSVMFITNGFIFMNDSISAVSGYFSIPTWITYTVILIITAFFIFSVLSVVFGKDL